MKKLFLVLAALLVLVGCTNGGGTSGGEGQTTNKEMETVKIFKGSYMSLFPEDIQQEIYSMGLTMEDGEVSVLGADLSGYKFTTADGKEASLPKEGPYILEVVGSWCGYCQALTSAVIDSGLYKQIPVYQYFMYGEAADIASFYEAVGVAKPDEITAFVGNETFEALLQQHEFYSVPLTLVVNSNGKVSFTHLGYMPAEDYKNFIDYGLAAKLYETKVEGKYSLPEYLARQDKIRAYINSLEEIEVPKEIFN